MGIKTLSICWLLALFWKKETERWVMTIVWWERHKTWFLPVFLVSLQFASFLSSSLSFSSVSNRLQRMASYFKILNVTVRGVGFQSTIFLTLWLPRSFSCVFHEEDINSIGLYLFLPRWYFQYNCEKECPCRPENKLSAELNKSSKDQDHILAAPKKVRFTVVPVTETFSLSDKPRSGWFWLHLQVIIIVILMALITNKSYDPLDDPDWVQFILTKITFCCFWWRNRNFGCYWMNEKKISGHELEKRIGNRFVDP